MRRYLRFLIATMIVRPYRELPGLIGANFLQLRRITMTWQTVWALVAASTGLMSGIWLCVSTISKKASTISAEASQCWDSDKAVASALVSQSAEYLAGALLLLFSFGLQIAAVLAPATSPQWHCPVWQAAGLILLATLAISGLFAYLTFVLRRRYLQVRIPILAQQPT